jgi:hypothetical protein
MEIIDRYIQQWKRQILVESDSYVPVKFKRINYNKWGKNIDDCAIRSISAGLGMDYEVVCKKLEQYYKKRHKKSTDKFKCKRGYGLVTDEGVDLEYIKGAFDRYFDVVHDFTEKMSMDDIRNSSKDMGDEDFIDVDMFDDEMEIDSFSSGITLDEFLSVYMRGQGNFLVGLVANKDAENRLCRQTEGHIVFGSTLKGKVPFFVDTWNCGEMLVDSYMRIKKTVPKESDEHWKYDSENRRFI